MKKLSRASFYRVHDPKNLYVAMKNDVELLLGKRAYLSLTTVIMCCIDALAAGSGKATYGKFETFVKKHFADLCSALDHLCPGQRGSRILYDEFRNGFAHLRGPKSNNYAIAEDAELGGAWADQVDVDGVGQFVAINIDLLARTFTKLLDDLAAS